jgi:uncharacterized protein with HEPN domain
VIAPRLADYLAHLKQAIEDACSFVEGLSKGEFMADRRTQQAVIMSLMTIGEVAARILARHPEFADRHPEVPWRQMRGMRNRLVHGYFEVDLDVVWETTRMALPRLRQSLGGIDPDANSEH